MQCGNFFNQNNFLIIVHPSQMDITSQDYIEQNYFLKNSLVQINSKLNEKNSIMITYTNHMIRTELSNLKQEKKLVSYLQNILSFNSTKFCVDYIVFCFQSIYNLGVELNRNQRKVNFINFQEHAQNVLINFL